jgi:hypothetical protein
MFFRTFWLLLQYRGGKDDYESIGE